jgi:hypothetical protein
MATIASERPASRLRAAPRDWNLLGVVALGAMLVIAAIWLMYETRGTTLWFDEWQWALEYRDNTLHGFIAPHNGHPTLVPVAIYRLLFATVGIDRSAPYRAVGIAGHLLVVALLYRYALRRVGVAPALLAAGVILFLGPGWQNILWGLQIGWAISVAAGLGALIALDRRDRFGDVGACVLLLIAVASSGPGIAVAIGLLVELVRGRGLRAAWIAVVPLGLFAVWWLAYQDTGAVRHEWGGAPGFALDSAAATLSAIVGLAGPLIGPDGATLGWGRPLLVAAAALLLWRLWRLPAVPTRVLTLLAILASFWLLTAVQRAGIGPAESSRYVYVGAVFTVALIVELVAGIAVPRRAWLVLGAAGALVLVANAGAMRTGARFLREQGLLTRTGLTTLEITRPIVRPDHAAAGIAGYPYVVVRAGEYFAMARDMGTPAATVDELAHGPENVRRAADDELTRIHGVRLQPVEPSTPGPVAPTVDRASGGTIAQHGGCVAFTPAPAGPAEPAPAVDLTVPAGGLVITATGGSAEVAVRRFAAGFAETPIGQVAAGGSGALAIRGDLASTPWHARVSPAARMTACALSR